MVARTPKKTNVRAGPEPLPFKLKKTPSPKTIAKTSRNPPFMRGKIPTYQDGDKEGEPTSNMYIEYLSAYEDKDACKDAMALLTLAGDNPKYHPAQPDDNLQYFRLKVHSPKQAEKINSMLNSLPKTVVESIDWSVEFNPKALEKLHIDIIPHPDEPDMHVALGNTFPMMDKMKAALGIFKYESQIGNGARAFPTSDLEKCVDTFHDWGFITHVHDKVEVVEE